jgi:hypothetical protein
VIRIYLAVCLLAFNGLGFLASGVPVLDKVGFVELVIAVLAGRAHYQGWRE